MQDMKELDNRIDVTAANWGDPVVIEAGHGWYVVDATTLGDPHIQLNIYWATLGDLEADDAASAAAMEAAGGYASKLDSSGALLFPAQARELAALLVKLADEAETAEPPVPGKA